MKGRAYEIKPVLSISIFDKKMGLGVTVKEQLAEEWHKSAMKKSKRSKVYGRYKDNIWAAGLVEMGSLSSKNKIIKYLLCVTDVFTKYALVKPLKDKKVKTVLNAFIGIVKEFNHKSNKLMQEWLDNNNILMYLT